MVAQTHTADNRHPAPIVCTLLNTCALPGHGRYIVVYDDDGVRVRSAAGNNLLDADLHRALRGDTHTLIDALLEWTRRARKQRKAVRRAFCQDTHTLCTAVRDWVNRARIVDGDVSPTRLEQPLTIAMNRRGYR